MRMTEAIVADKDRMKGCLIKLAHGDSEKALAEFMASTRPQDVRTKEEYTNFRIEEVVNEKEYWD